MKKQLLLGMSIATILFSTPTIVFAMVDDDGCEWGTPSNPIVVGDNSHGAGAGSSSGSSQEKTQVSGGGKTPSASVGQESSGGSSGTTSQDNTNPGGSYTEKTPGSSSTTNNTTPGSSSSSTTGGGSSSSSTSGGSSSSGSTSEGGNSSGSTGDSSSNGGNNSSSQGNDGNGNNGNGGNNSNSGNNGKPGSTGSKDSTTGNKDGNGNNTSGNGTGGNGTGTGGNENGANGNGTGGNGTGANGNGTGGNENGANGNGTGGNDSGSNANEGNSNSNNDSGNNGNHNNTGDRDVSYVFDDKWTSENHYNEDGTINWTTVPGTVTGVTVNKDGTMTVHVVDSTGGISSINWNDYWNQMITQTVTDKDGNEITKTTTISLKEGVQEEWTYLYTSWSIMNETNPESKYYGGFTKVAQTKESSAELWPDLDGRYRVIGTPWFHVRYYKIVEHCEDDGDGSESCWDEEVTVGEETLSKEPTQYTVDVPIICLGCPVPVMCINGACDSSQKLNSVSDDANKPEIDIEEWTALEK